MENISIISTILLNLGLCLFLALYFKRIFARNEIRLKKVKWLYVISALIILLLVSSIALTGFVILFEAAGFIQEFGHPGIASGFILSFLIGTLFIPMGLIMINWKPMNW